MWTSEAVAVKMKMVNGLSKRNDLSRFSPPEEGDRLNFFFWEKKAHTGIIALVHLNLNSIV